MTALKISTNEYFNQAISDFAKTQGETNPLALENISFISINSGVGKFDPKQKQEIQAFLTALTGQEAKEVFSKLSIASFKLRKGQTVGFVTTLRGERMKSFLMQLVYVALPRTRDFRGISDASFNKDNSCYSLGIKNASIFPSIGFDTSINFGFQINIVFKTGSEKNIELLKTLNLPFNKK